VSFPFDACLVLGKELRRDPERARRELKARAAAASAALRAGAGWVATLEAKLRGQEASGAELVREFLLELGVPDARIVMRPVTRSTREEAVLGTALFEERQARRGLVLTARYHVARTRRLFGEASAAAEVHTPEALWRHANPREREWIAAGEPDEDTMAREAPVERVFGLLEGALRPLPVGMRNMVEIGAGVLWRGATER
jgi:hypothetical protein